MKFAFLTIYFPIWPRMSRQKFKYLKKKLGGSGEKSPSKNMKVKFYQLSNLSQPVFLLENPAHWGLETVVCPNCAKPVSDIFAVLFTGT